ncbi:serine/threonine-protein kinase Nek4-like isoform X2 [Anneissia japonica]|nr:serine/threonine-protein kinase Nek4-like isoform X2 [Anneissia japonica]
MHYFVQVVLAVQYIHSQKILHRDLKTQNVFVTKMGLVKLGDFGIAKSLDQTLDKASTCVGTPCYLSPELCQDIPYNSKSDVWALGCLLYEMCAFQPAFDASNLISLFYKIVKCEHSEIPEEYSEQLVTLVNSILIKDPDKRPSANTLLSSPFMQQHLAAFIDGTEQVRNQIQRAKQEDTKRNVDQNTTEIPKTPVEPRESGEYSDDFSSSEEDDDEDNEIEEIFDESIESSSDVRNCNNNHHGNSKTPDDDDEVVEYADDFEEDSDVDLDDVLCHAKTAVGIKASQQSFHNEDDDEDDECCQERPVSSCRNFIKEQCIENLGGVEVYEKWKKTCGDLKPDENMHSSASLEFEHFVGIGQRETCYLLSELMTASNNSED